MILTTLSRKSMMKEMSNEDRQLCKFDRFNLRRAETSYKFSCDTKVAGYIRDLPSMKEQEKARKKAERMAK